jgi:hypothetical protein
LSPSFLSQIGFSRLHELRLVIANHHCFYANVSAAQVTGYHRKLEIWPRLLLLRVDSVFLMSCNGA